MTLRFSDLNPVGRAIITVATVAALTFGVAAISFATSYGALYAYVRDTGLYSDRLTRLWPLLDEAFVRWKVAKQRWKSTFKTAALADSFRSDLLAAARKGEPSISTLVGRSPCSGPARTCPGMGSPARSPT
jgi:hypothetical protein